MLDYNEIYRVTRFTIHKYSIPLLGMTPDDFCHEVAVYMFRTCKLENPGATAIIKNVFWTYASLREKRKVHPPINHKGNCYIEHPEDALDDKYLVRQILTLRFRPQERSVLEMMLNDLDTTEILDKMGFSRQRLHQIKKSAFERVIASPIGKRTC